MPPFWRMPVNAPDRPEVQPAATRSAAPPLAQTPFLTDGGAATAMVASPAQSVRPVPALRGTAQVLSTATLMINGQRVQLAHLEGVEGAQTRGLAAFIASRGGTVLCEPAPPALGMRCRTDDGVDLAAAALFNGGGRAGPGAPDEYRVSEDAARQAGRGIWASTGR